MQVYSTAHAELKRESLITLESSAVIGADM